MIELLGKALMQEKVIDIWNVGWMSVA